MRSLEFALVHFMLVFLLLLIERLPQFPFPLSILYTRDWYIIFKAHLNSYFFCKRADGMWTSYGNLTNFFTVMFFFVAHSQHRGHLIRKIWGYCGKNKCAIKSSRLNFIIILLSPVTANIFFFIFPMVQQCRDRDRRKRERNTTKQLQSP